MRIHYQFRFVALSLLLWNACTNALHLENEETEEVELPSDPHFSATALSHELRDDVECMCSSRKAINQVNKSRKEARIFYLVSIHNNRTLEDSVYLLRAIRDHRNTILIHIDTKFNFSNYQTSLLRQEIEACPCGSHVEVASVHNAAWGTWSMNLQTLWAMEKATADYKDKWDVFINLSGDSLPVYTPDRIAKLFGGPLAGVNFITSSSCETGLIPTPISAFPESWHKRRHYSQHPMSLNFVDEHGKAFSNVTLEIYFGSQWMTLLPDWCEWLVQELKRDDSLPSQFRNYLISTRKLMTDETFIPTLMMYLQPQILPKVNEDYSLVIPNKTEYASLEMYTIRYERMDEHYPNSKGWYPAEQRYDVPESSGIETPKPWGPYFLGVYDLENIRAYGALYIRKVATKIDPNLFHLLPVDVPEEIPPIHWPNEVKLTPKPTWEKKLAELKQKHANAKKKDAQLDVVEDNPKTGDDGPGADGSRSAADTVSISGDAKSQQEYKRGVVLEKKYSQGAASGGSDIEMGSTRIEIEAEEEEGDEEKNENEEGSDGETGSSQELDGNAGEKLGASEDAEDDESEEEGDDDMGSVLPKLSVGANPVERPSR